MVQDLTAAQPDRAVLIRVQSQADVQRVAGAAQRFAAALGFDASGGGEISLAAAELASNLIQHASGGSIKLTPVQAGGCQGIQVESEDDGPGIADLEQALTDGYSTSGSLGIGLGTVHRLMHELEVHSRAPCGLHLVCRRWMRPRSLAASGLAFGAATRACRYMRDNGDAFLIRQWDGNALVGVIDGIGHGQYAQRASQAARYYIEQHFDQPLESLFRGVGRACRATRGVVMALARFDLPRQKLSLASVGNIEVRLIGSADRLNLVVRRGIIGLNAPAPVCTDHHWNPAYLLIMHSDGLRSHWEWNDFRSLWGEAPGIIARRMLQALGRIEDDATVVVARGDLP